MTLLDRTATVRNPTETVVAGLISQASVVEAADVPCAIALRSPRAGGRDEGGPYGEQATRTVDADIYFATLEPAVGREITLDDGRVYVVVAPALKRTGQTIAHVQVPVRRVQT